MTEIDTQATGHSRHGIDATDRVGDYEHGLLHPHLGFDAEKLWLKTVIDPRDREGNVPIWEFTEDTRVQDWH